MSTGNDAILVHLQNIWDEMKTRHLSLKKESTETKHEIIETREDLGRRIDENSRRIDENSRRITEMDLKISTELTEVAKAVGTTNDLLTGWG